MEQSTPSWLDKDFLAECLRSEKDNQNIEVTDLKASLAAPAGNSYGGCVVRVKVDYKETKEDAESQSVSLIVKSEVTEGPLKDVLQSSSMLLLKEPAFYKRFLPAASKLAKTDFAPKTFFSPRPTVTVMEDLKVQGFVMADRVKQLDFDHCRLYMEAAASFHAVSFAVHKQDPELIESIGQDAIYSNPKMADMFKITIKNGFKKLADVIDKMEKLKKYRNLIEDVSENLWDKVDESLKPRSHLNTLTQGDPWITNMMFNYDDKGLVKEVKLLDFQNVRYTCPVNDVVFFIWSSCTHEVRRNRLNDLYKIYLDTFNLKLQELDCTEKMTFDQFMGIVKELSYFIIYLIGTCLPYFCDPEPVDAGSLFAEETASGGNPYDKVYTESFCKNRLIKFLEELELFGVFDYLEKERR